MAAALVIAIAGSGLAGKPGPDSSAAVLAHQKTPTASSEGSAAAVKCPPNAKPVEGGCIPRSAVRIVAGERCRSARKAVSHYRALTWERQEARGGDLADRTPLVRGKTCRWARYAAAEHQARAKSALRSLQRWQRDVGRIVSLLERGLRGSPMEGTAIELEREGRRHGVSPFFMAAVAATESSLGRAACSSNRFNAWGLANCTGIWYVPPFGSWGEAYAFYADFLASRWPGHSTPYSFNGYAACDDCWARKVSFWMRELFGVSARTVYP